MIEIVIRNSGECPIYEQIVRQSKAQIIRGSLLPDQALPSIRNLAKDLRISVITTKRAYDELEKEGFIYSIPAKGFFVSPQNTQLIREENLKKIENLLAEAAALGRQCGLTPEELTEMLRLEEEIQ
ncbi:MAG TPA: GntR family transcriptional regulator [Candidatus Scubalenecus merdavium]|uniref:GntR family transcriptional regulator n=1 Tax=Candidatus Scybalenecus merdavium TaxID=2840939 RepID=A0A9D1SNN4_9FIRM|nr:GntR family transcriptional regulator [Candidatus Scubalenecus merdavium]